MYFLKNSIFEYDCIHNSKEDLIKPKNDKFQTYEIVFGVVNTGDNLTKLNNFAEIILQRDHEIFDYGFVITIIRKGKGIGLIYVYEEYSD